MTIGLPDEDNIFKWRIVFAGPKDSLYKGGIYNEVRTTFRQSCFKAA